MPVNKSSKNGGQKMDEVVGRFAPTPSGYAHIGNLFCFLLAWLSVKKQNGKIVLRMEDLDTQRTSVELANETMEDLRWLGLTWDYGPGLTHDSTQYFQSKRSSIYIGFFDQLKEKGFSYPCYCSRTDVKNANAPHLSDGRIVYPGTCKNLAPDQQVRLSRSRAPAWRLSVNDETISFVDRLQGTYSQNLLRECGDFPIRRADGVFCYQLAVIIDDALMGVNEVVRASDLLSSTPQQIYLYKLLDFPVPEFIHIPTVLDAQGKRLAKRDRSISLHDLKSKYTREEILGRLAYMANLQTDITPRTLDDLLDMFCWNKVRRDDICLPPDLF